MASTVLSTNLLANQDSPFVDYKFLLEKYVSPHVIVGYDNDSQCWCFQRRFYVTFKNQLRMLMEDQWGSHLAASEGQETIVEFNESMVIECKSYNAEDFAKPNRPKAGLKHSLVVYYVPKRIVERVGENGATTVKASYPESILIVYPNRRVQNLAEWYVNNARNPKSGRNLYAYNVKDEYWMRKYQYIELEQSHVYGIDDKFEMFERDFNIIHQKIDKLHKVGKSCSLNYFVHGPPGTGKSSFARAIATKYNLDIYTANLKDCQHIKDSDAVKTILTPSKIIFKQDNEEKKEDCDDDCCDNLWCDDDGCETVVNPKQNQYYVVLIEDFDRYLDSCTANEMSNILNSIDGVEPSDGVIRFFSANNTEDIKLNKAFLSRMNGIWHFSLNDKASIKKRVLELFETPLYHENSTEITIQDLYTEKASNYKLSLREITNHLCRFLMDEVNGIKSALEDLDRFVSEKDIKVESDAVVLNSGETAKNQQEKTEESETCEKLE